MTPKQLREISESDLVPDKYIDEAFKFQELFQQGGDLTSVNNFRTESRMKVFRIFWFANLISGYSSNMDTNGIIYWLGTDEGRRKEWKNPGDFSSQISDSKLNRKSFLFREVLCSMATTIGSLDEISVDFVSKMDLNPILWLTFMTTWWLLHIIQWDTRWLIEENNIFDIGTLRDRMMGTNGQRSKNTRMTLQCHLPIRLLRGTSRVKNTFECFELFKRIETLPGSLCWRSLALRFMELSKSSRLLSLLFKINDSRITLKLSFSQVFPRWLNNVSLFIETTRFVYLTLNLITFIHLSHKRRT